MSSNNIHKKKLKKSSSNFDGDTDNQSISQEKEEIEILKRHILSCKELPGSSCAIRAALNGLEKELQRINRDQKLREKFSKPKSNMKERDDVNESDDDSDWKIEEGMEKNKTGYKVNGADDKGDDAILMEWQDVNRSPTSELSAAGLFSEESIIGKKLAEEAISKIASVDAKVSDGLSAIAVVIHSALLSDLLNFKCTGVPDTNTSTSSGGFAKPIRELPKDKFLPDEFYKVVDRNNLHIRYRKKETGTVILTLSQKTTKETSNITSFDSVDVYIEFAPNTSRSELIAQGPLVFPISKHLNLDSFGKALNSAKKINNNKDIKILPTLHYKHLSALMAKFISTFDVGQVIEPNILLNKNDEIMPDRSIEKNNHNSSNEESESVRLQNHAIDRNSSIIHNIQPTFERGSFDSDLHPQMLFTRRPQTGSLMGPNHPMFHGSQRETAYEDEDHYGVGRDGFPHMDGNYDDPFNPRIGRSGMRPRFDPYGPPGGPMDFQRNQGRGGGRGRGRGGRGGHIQGAPNPDHQRPPNFGNNMFM